MKCPKQTAEGPELLLEFSSGSLDGEWTAAVEGHVRECAACAAFVAGQRKISEMLDGWEAPAVSADFDRRLYARIGEEVPWWEFLARPFRGAFTARWLPVATAAGLMIVLGLWIQRPGDVPKAPATAQVEALPPEQAADALQEMQVMQEFSNLIHSDAEPRM